MVSRRDPTGLPAAEPRPVVAQYQPRRRRPQNTNSPRPSRTIPEYEYRSAEYEYQYVTAEQYRVMQRRVDSCGRSQTG